MNFDLRKFIRGDSMTIITVILRVTYTENRIGNLLTVSYLIYVMILCSVHGLRMGGVKSNVRS